MFMLMKGLYLHLALWSSSVRYRMNFKFRFRFKYNSMFISRAKCHIRDMVNVRVRAGARTYVRASARFLTKDTSMPR